MSDMKWTAEHVEHVLEEILDPKDKKRARIVEAAASLFVEQGFRKTSMEEIAQLAGVAKGTVYLYAKNKAELLLQALAAEKLKHKDLIVQVLDPKRPAVDRLRHYVELAFTAAKLNPLYAKVLAGDRDLMIALADSMGPTQENARAMGAEFIAEMIEAIAPGRLPLEERKDRGRALLALLMFAAQLDNDKVRDGLSLERTAELLSGMIVEGIAGPERKKP